MAPIIEANGLVKHFGNVRAIDGLDLVAESGRITALLGPNGAGKTTFINAVATLVRPTSGSLRVAGIDVVAEPKRVRRVIGLAVVLTLAHLPGFYQTQFFIYQLIGLRVLWACVVRRGPRPLRLMALTAVALVLPALLGAAQLLPSLEVARESLRGLQLTARDIGGGFSWSSLVESLMSQVLLLGNVPVVVLAMLALAPLSGVPCVASTSSWQPISGG